MGYCSQVGLCLTAKGSAQLKEKLAKFDHKEEVSSLLKYTNNTLSDADSGAEMLFWDWFKWYEEFPEVRFFMELLDELDNRDFYFIRIGEDYDDNEFRGGFDENPFHMTFVRQIQFEQS